MIVAAVIQEVVVINQDSIQKLNNFQEAERLIDKYGGKAVETFEKVVEGATPLAKEGFNMAVKLQFAQGVAQLLPIIFFGFFIYKFIKEDKYIRKEGGEWESGEVTASWIIYLALSIITMLLAIFNTYGGVTRVIAPEWYAVKEIVELFK